VSNPSVEFGILLIVGLGSVFMRLRNGTISTSPTIMTIYSDSSTAIFSEKIMDGRTRQK